MGVSYLVGHVSHFNYNAWYGSASKSLIDTTITQIEEGNVNRVMSVLRRLNLDYYPTYENRAHYDEYVDEAVAQMISGDDLQNTKWDTSPLTRGMWEGVWENDLGLCVVVNNSFGTNVIRYGDKSSKATNVTVSDDCMSRSFTEDDQWRHELTLTNKYEAKHKWQFIGKDGDNAWHTDTLHKLRRATSAERAFTQQEIRSKNSETNKQVKLLE